MGGYNVNSLRFEVTIFPAKKQFLPRVRGRSDDAGKEGRPTPPPPLEWNSILSLVTAVLITPKGAEPPGSRRIGIIGALVLILSSETV